MARPTNYNPEIAAKICELIAGGSSLRSLCEERDDMPGERTVFQWLAKHPEFAQQYTRAREAWADAEFENLMHIADTPVLGTKTKTTEDGVEHIEGDMIEHRRLQVDTRKWALARMSPKKYGDKITNELTGPNGQPLGNLSDEQIAAALNKLSERVAHDDDQPGSDLV